MKKTIKLTALTLAIVMIASCLLSCDLLFGTDPTDELRKAEETLTSVPYRMVTDIDYASDDEAMTSAAEKIFTPSIELCVDEDRLYANLITYLDGRLLSHTYTLVDGMMYYNAYEECEDTVYTSKKKAAATDDIKKSLLDSLGEGAQLRADDFKSVSAVKKGGITAVVCTDINDTALYGITNMLQDKLTEIGAIVSVKDVELSIQIEDGRYLSSVLVCSYVIVTPTDVYTLSMKSTSAFDYGDEIEIKAPANADEYIEAPIF